MANIMAHSSHSLSHGTPERDTSPTPFLLLANSINLLDNVLCLQEEMNDAMVHLLSTRATIDTSHQWVILRTEVSHCQNEMDTFKAIREVKGQYAATIEDPESTYRTTMSKVEAVHLASTSEAEVFLAIGIRKAKAANAMQASKLQQQHQEAMQNLEEKALEVEKHTHQYFLWAFGVALQACPNETLAKLMYPLNQLMGSPSLPGPLTVTSLLTARLKNPITSPITPADPWLWFPLPGLHDTNLQSGKLKQIIPGSQPHKGGERKILWWGTWGTPAVTLAFWCLKQGH